MFLIPLQRSVLISDFPGKKTSHFLNCTGNISDNTDFFKWYGSCEHHYLHSCVDTDLLPDFEVSWELQCNVFINLLWFLTFFSGAAHNKHCQLVEILVECSILECVIQKSAPRSLQLKKCYFEE